MHCPNCDRKLRLPDTASRKSVQCPYPGCGFKFKFVPGHGVVVDAKAKTIRNWKGYVADRPLLQALQVVAIMGGAFLAIVIGGSLFLDNRPLEPTSSVSPNISGPPVRSYATKPSPPVTQTAPTIETKIAEPAVDLQIEEPETGRTLVRRTRSRGLGWLSVNNGTNSDAAVALCEPGSKKATIKFYVRAHDEFRFKEVPERHFIIYFETGEDWSNLQRKFTANRSMSRFENVEDFHTHPSANGRTYLTLSVTLHPVPNGKAKIDPVYESEFPD